MALHHNPRIVTDGLVLYLDTANTKSFRGEPTINILSSSTDPSFENGTKSGDGWVYDSKTDGSYEYYSLDSYKGTYSMKLTNSTIGAIAFWRQNIPVTEGLYYTISVYTKDINCPMIPYFSKAGALSGSNVYFTGISTSEWKRFEGTYLASSTGDAQFYIRTTNDAFQGSFLIDNIQIEQKSYATPFVNGTRGTTAATGGGLEDLSGNENHGELVGPIYDSDNNGSLVFDGTGTTDGVTPGSYVSVTESITSTNNYINGCTYSVWINVDSDAVDRMSLFFGTNTRRHIEIYSSSKNFRTEAALQNGYSFGSGSFPDNVRGVWSNIIIVFATNEPGRPVRWYQNGELFYTGSLDGGDYPGTEYFSFSKIGRSTGSVTYNYAKSFKGKIANTKIYNRSLIQSEITQNFNTLKGRFGL
jgi:hypothetical protein